VHVRAVGEAAGFVRLVELRKVVAE
jgi:hypothetical protein